MLRRTNAAFVGVCVVLASVGLAPTTVRALEPVRERHNGWSVQSTEAVQATVNPSAPESLNSVDVMALNCTSVDFTAGFVKLKDVDTFFVGTAGATAIITAHGRFGIETLATGSGAVFEIRVDDQAPVLGYARPSVRSNEVGLDPAVQNSATGVFGNLGVGTHMVSIWVRGGDSGSGTRAMIDPGCWSSDHLVVEVHEGTAPQPFAVFPASLPAFTATSTKIADIGSFHLDSNNSVVELTYSGRFAVSSFDPASNGAVFELRVDDQLSPLGWAAALIRDAEAGGSGKPIRINAVFPYLEAGPHTASIWVFGSSAGGSDAQINPGGWYDQLLVTEHQRVRATVMNIPFDFGVPFSQSPTKVRDFGSFDVADSSSLVELNLNGRFGATTIDGDGVHFELRVDDLPVTIGRAKIPLKPSEVGFFGDDLPASMTAFFTGLAPGSHTASLWVTGLLGGGTFAGINRGGWDADHLVVFEHGFNWIFTDGFESGGTLSWSSVVP
jgi:hypothetical protein